MTGNPKDRPHWRTLEMARALGRNIAAALHDRSLSRQDYGDMVETCARCTWAEGCAVWARSLETAPAAPPEICGNRDAFERLGR